MSEVPVTAVADHLLRGGPTIAYNYEVRVYALGPYSIKNPGNVYADDAQSGFIFTMIDGNRIVDFNFGVTTTEPGRPRPQGQWAALAAAKAFCDHMPPEAADDVLLAVVGAIDESSR